MAYSSPDPLSANWSYDSAIDLFSLNTMVPESFPIDIPNDMLWDAKDLPADFFAAPTDINGFTVSHDESLSSVCPPSLSLPSPNTNRLQDESDDQAFSPTAFMASTPPSALDLPSPMQYKQEPLSQSQIQTIQPCQAQLQQHQQPKRKASSISTSSSLSTGSPHYSPASSPELIPQQTTRKTRASNAANGDNTARGRNAAKRAAHNIIEKRYRTNMNAKFVALEKAMAVKPAGVSKSVVAPAPTTSAKGSASLKKSEILSNAIAYMQELQEANERLRKEVNALAGRRGY
ncbi:uncharacterized protein BDV14DRAFT_180125 [Aspergillus stella-maris]|uniref:uncharacterized protein n=1 Tax=Aspergillus stella-maris TaxID=1810926 RepID=UPI003CCD5AE2